MTQPIHPIIQCYTVGGPNTASFNLNARCPNFQVINPPSEETYPCKITKVVFEDVYKFPKSLPISMRTEENHYANPGRRGVEPCASYDLTKIFSSTLVFAHSCDFSLNVQYGKKTVHIQPNLGQENTYRIEELFNVRVAEKSHGGCTIL